MAETEGFGVKSSPALPEPMNSLILHLVEETGEFYNPEHMKFFASKEGLEVIQDSFWFLFFVKHGVCFSLFCHMLTFSSPSISI